MKITKRSFIIILVAGVFISLLSFFVFYSDIPWNKWNANKVYREYHSAVVLVHTKWSYRIKVDGKDITGDFYKLNTGTPQRIIGNYEERENGNFYIENRHYECTATAFFIREDGMLATNLHVVCPWLFDVNAENRKNLEKDLRRFYDGKASKNDTLYRYIANNLKVEGVLDSIWIIENGKADIVKNRIPCKLLEGDSSIISELYNREDTNYYDYSCDATIFQTANKKLPSSLEKVIPICNFNDSFDRIGEEIFSIGYPYGNSSVSIPSWEKYGELCNIINNGIISQDRGLLGFGHNISSPPGSSGSPIINSKGKLSGLHSSGKSGVSGIDGLNQAVSIELISICLHKWDEYQVRHKKRNKH